MHRGYRHLLPTTPMEPLKKKKCLGASFEILAVLGYFHCWGSVLLSSYIILMMVLKYF